MQAHTIKTLSRRHFLGLLPGALGFLFAVSNSAGSLSAQSQTTLINRFLGESLFYQIGFWLIPRCGTAQTSFLKTEQSGLYRASLEGRTTGVIDVLLGRIRYSFVSYMGYVAAEDRLKPFYFQVRKKHMQKQSIRSVAYDYERKKIFYSHRTGNSESRQKTEDMASGINYEDYLSLFFNFRNGVYGPLKNGRTYRIPLHIHKGMKPLELTVAPDNQAITRCTQESDQTDKDFFLRFKVAREDISSKSGEVEGWLSGAALPMKGTLKDVVFFGDLWGELDRSKVEYQNKTVPVPEVVRNHIAPD